MKWVLAFRVVLGWIGRPAGWLLALLRRLRPSAPDVTPHEEKAEIRQRLTATQQDVDRLERLAREYRDFGRSLR